MTVEASNAEPAGQGVHTYAPPPGGGGAWPGVLEEGTAVAEKTGTEPTPQHRGPPGALYVAPGQ